MENKKENFGDIYQSLSLQHLHREFTGQDEDFLAIFALFELFHNFDQFVDYVNSEGEEKESRWNAAEWFYKRIKGLEEGKIEVRREVWKYAVRKKNIFVSKKAMEKQAAQKALFILRNNRAGNYIFRKLEEENFDIE